MRTVRLLALALLPLLASSPVSATSYVPMTDAALVDQAPVIAMVEVLGSGPGPESVRPSTAYRVRVERVLKGALASGLGITVRVPGGVRADGMGLRIWGAPRFTRGERALLFLSPNLDGSYNVVHLMLGAFHEVRAGGQSLAVRDLAEARPVARPGEPLPQESLRDFDRFVSWIAARARGMRLQADYRVAAAPDLDQITDAFTLFEDPSDGYNLRWFDFDTGGSVEWRAHQDGQQGVTGGGFAEFQTAIAAWNNDPDTRIDYTYGGTTTSTNGLLTYDTVNAILFNDPNNELPSFSCTSGGVLAYGGPWYYSSTLSYQGTPYHPVPNADVVINNGLTCFFQDSPNGSKAAEELFAHELGHTLGINHSTELDALMYPYIHDDGRGALLHADDRAAIAFLYSASLPTDFFTLPSCRLLDTRNATGPYGGPVLQTGLPRTFAAAGRCGIPSTAVALSVNITAIGPSGIGYLTLFPADRPQPGTSNLRFSTGRTLANNAILLLSSTPEQAFTVISVIGDNGATHLAVDVNGYFE